MKPIQFLTNRNGVYYFRRVVPISLRSILNRREIVLTLKTSDFKDACMAALEMSKELDGLFNRLKQGVELITPSEQDLFAAACRNNTAKRLRDRNTHNRSYMPTQAMLQMKLLWKIRC